MWNKPTVKQLQVIPGFYQTEKIPTPQKVIHMHFFLGRSSWYVAEFDGEDLFFGFAVLNGDYECAEWGYFSLEELVEINIQGFQIDRDLHWKPTPAGEIEAIRGYV